MGKTGGGLFDLERHFAFYGAYHTNSVNVLIHTFLVWPILFASFLLFYFTPPIYDLSKAGVVPNGYDRILVLNFGTLVALGCALFYVRFDKKAGSLAALLCLASWFGAYALAPKLGPSLTRKVGIAAQFICWVGQFIGHGVFERRAPALFDNLLQAFLMAPFFVLLEVLQTFFGYEPYPGFHESVKAKVDAEVKEWQEKKQKKAA